MNILRILFCCHFFVVYFTFKSASQAVVIFSTPRNIHERTAIDSSNVRIWYSLNALDINKSDTYDDLQCLEIGDTISRYHSYFIYKSDSLYTKWKNENPNPTGAPSPSFGREGKQKNRWSEYYFSDYIKNHSSRQLSVHTFTPRNIAPLKYNENLPVQDWILYDDTLTIAGQLCQKAVCRFRGRDFTAWFAPEIPISDGPWKFGGLPGLILKVYDSDNLYVFECCKIEVHKQACPILIYSTKYSETNRLKYSIAMKKINEDYFNVAGWKREDGTSAPKLSSILYQPLELE